MKKSEEIIGLPIISISDGNEVGKVKAILINEVKGSIDYVIVDNGINLLNDKVISTEKVLGIGEYALTIENEDVIKDISEIPAAIELYKKNIAVKGTKIMTKKGQLIGQTGDIYVNEDNNCSIVGLEFINNKTQDSVKIIPRKSVITFGKNLLIVKDDVESNLLNSAEQIDSINGQSNIEKSALENNSKVSNEVSSTDKEGEIPSEAVSDMMEMKHKEYLTGKTTTKTIYDDDGSVLIEENTVIDEDVFEIAKAYDKVIELVMNNR